MANHLHLAKLVNNNQLDPKTKSILYTEPQEILNRFEEHFSQLLNDTGMSDPQRAAEVFMEQQPILHQLDEAFTIQELEKGLQSMKFGKATGSDQIPIEVLRNKDNILREVILHLFNLALHQGIVPQEWKDVIITILFKKGDPSLCDNYRGISLIAHLGKLLERLVTNRIVPVVTNIAGCIPDTQCGFMKNRSTVDAIIMSRFIAATATEFNSPLFKCYVDLTKAYDKLDREILWMLLERIGLPPLFHNLIRQLLQGSNAKVLLHGLFSQSFALTVGLKV